MFLKFQQYVWDFGISTYVWNFDICLGFRHMFGISALVSDLGFRQINLIPKLSFDYSRIQTCFGMYTFQHPTLAITEGKQKDLVAGFMQNIMQLESSHHTNTRKRKASVAFDDEFDYLYGIVTTGRACVIFFL